MLASTGTGDIIPNATVTVRNPGTTTNISETIYVNDDPDLSQYVNGNFQTSATGIVVFYLTNQKRVDVLFTKAGFTSVTIPVDVQKSSLVSGESVATSTIWDAKGDLAAGTGADAASRLAVGANDTALTADSAQATGLKWVAYQALSVYDAAGDILYGSANDTSTRLPIGAASKILQVNAGATAPTWGPTILTATTTWDPGSLAADAVTFEAVTVTGAAMGDIAIGSLSASDAARTRLLVTAYVSAADTVIVQIYNKNAAAIDLASGTLRAMVVKF